MPMTPTPNPPPSVQRLLRLAERNPRRVATYIDHIIPTIPPSDSLLLAWMSYAYGWALVRWKHLAAARSYIQKAQNIFAEVGYALVVLHCHRAMLIAEILSGAGSHLQNALHTVATAYEALGSPSDALWVRLWQIRHLNMLGQSLQAFELIKQIEPDIQSIGDTHQQAYLLCVTAVAQANAGLLDDANTRINQAITLFTQLNSPINELMCRYQRAIITLRKEQFDQTMHDLDYVLTLAQRLDLPMETAFCLKEKGLVFSRLGYYDRALAATQQARERFVLLNRRDQVADCDLNLGVINHYSGLFDLAMAAYRHAENEYTALGFQRKMLISQRNQALILHDQNQSTQALQLLQKLEEIVRNLDNKLELAELLLNQALVYRTTKAYDRALNILQTAHEQFIAAGNIPGAAKSMLEQGWIYVEKNDAETAQNYLQQARDTLHDRPTFTWRANYGLARCAEMQHNHALALSYYQTASATIAKLRQTIASEHASSGVFAQAEHLFTDALNRAIQCNDPTTAIMFAEQQYGLSLQRQMAATTLLHANTTWKTTLDHHYAHLCTLMSEHASDDILDTALSNYIDTRMRSRHQQIATNDREAEPFDLATIRNQFSAAYPNGWVAIVYVLCGTTILMMTFDQHHITMEHTPFDEHLHALIQRACLPRYRRLVYLDLTWQRHPNHKPWETLTALAKRIISPVLRAKLSNDTRLLIVPAGPLHAIPWAAMRLDDIWLCEQAIIQILPSLTTWIELAKRPTPNQHAALVLGCSTFGQRAEPLPNVAAQLDLVEDLWTGSTTRLQDEQATRKALIELSESGALHQYRLLHLATHGQLISTQGILAHLSLWDTNIFLDEIARLSLQGATVILAACESASGQVLPGEEVLSINRAFLIAGARNVVASLWKTYDRAILGLLKPFYENIALGLDIPTALVQAQRTLLTQYQAEQTMLAIAYSPFVWASMSVLG